MLEKIKRRLKKDGECYLMLAPFIVLFTVFTAVPVLMSVPVGFTDFNMVQKPEFVGFSNYTALFLSDKIFMKSVRITLVFAFFTGFVSFVMCFFLAWLINQMSGFFRTFFTVVFYIPSMANVCTVWKVIFSGDVNGYLNSFLMDTGIITAPIQWLTDGNYVLATAVTVQLWLSLGSGFLALRAGFQNIDRSMYEAGAVEGIKNRWQELFYITIPCMKPHIMFAVVMQIVSSFTAGTAIQNVVGFPSTDYQAHTIMTHAYDYGWVRFEMGYSSAICMVLFAVMYAVNRIADRLIFKDTD